MSADANTAIFRYNTNGSFDNSFRVNGKNITDGALDGTGIDKVRMKIYNKTTGAVIYDNQQGASDAALPTHAVGANNVVVISGSNSSNIIKSRTTQNAEMKARMGAASNGSDGIAYANPSTNNFSLIVQATVGRKNIDASDRCVWKSN